MSTIKPIEVYQFSELSDDAKQKALETMFDINIDHDWYESTYEDAENVGLKITAFDIDRGSYCEGDFTGTAEDTAERILTDHGDTCETYATAKAFLAERAEILRQANRDGDENDDAYEDELETLDDQFLKDILEDYLTILRDEYEYQTSTEAIVETIEANEYGFTAEGSRKVYL